MRNSGKIPPQAAPGSSLATHDAFLRANSGAYEWLVEKIQMMDRRKQAEAVLSRVAMAAGLAANFHPGRFADGAIENVAFEIGARLDALVAEGGSITIPVVRKESRRRVLHVATCVIGLGGLTRMLYHWVRNDRNSVHSVLLVDQRGVPIPQWLSEAVRSSSGNLVVLPSGAGFCQKARWLRDTARRGADLVVLHHSPSDMVPIVAFTAPECPPVAVLNHADHHFWLGSSVADMVINLRTAGAEHTAERRFVSSNTVIPIPLADQVRHLSRRDARRALGIGEDRVMLLSVGRGLKYRPCGSYDFVATAGKILNRLPGAHLYVVGESPAGIAPYLRCALHERLHFVGEMEDLSLYHAAAGIYLESFPFGSQTALLEAALSGLPVVPAYAPLFPLLVANDDAMLDLLPNPENEHEYVERVDRLVQKPEERVERGRALRNRLLIDHVGEGWLHRLAALYQKTDCLTHSPRPIPASSCSMTDADISLTLWNVMADGRTSSTGVPMDDLKAVLRHTAFVAKEVGNYAAARRCAWSAMWQDPLTWMSWRLLGISLIGRAGRAIRRMQN